MDDYYSMLGVDADARIDDIRDAYRARKDSLDTASDTGKADAARLNKAWNVLSDPYQRGRYDEKRSQAIDDDDLDVSENGVGSSTTPASKDLTPRQQRAQAAREARAARANQPPTIKPPAGTHYPRVKQRMLAMGIDLLVLIAMGIVTAYAILPAVQKAQKPDVVHQVNQLNDKITADNKAVSDANKAVDEANKGNNQAAKDQATAAQKKAKHQQKADNDALTKAEDQLTPINRLVFAAYFFVAGLYLIIPSALTGRTLGKSRQHLKVVRQNGAPLGWGGAFSRYGLVVVVTAALFLTFLGPVGVVLVLFGVTMWMRNPNQQGLHDRFAKTIVVADGDAS